VKIPFTLILALAGAPAVFAQEAPPPPAPEPAPAEAAPATPTPAPSPTPRPKPLSARELINGLSESQIEQAISSLRSNFLDASRLDDKELRRATLQGLIARLSPGVSLKEAATPEPTSSSEFLAEILDDRIGYVRLGALNKEALPQMDAALANFKEKSLHAAILDLRGAPPSADYEVAKEIASRFCPKGKLLFTIQKPSEKQERILTSSLDPAFDGVLVVLTDADTSGSAEALAATLRLNANAMIVGETTSGEAVEFANVDLGDGKTLRVAVAQVILPETGAIFPEGVKPDIAAGLPPGVQERIFALSMEKGVSQFVFEKERPHLNEAALVANTNPEIDANRDATRGEERLWDSVLQRAVDLVTAISFYSDRK